MSDLLTDKGIQLVVRIFCFCELHLELQEYLRNRSLGRRLYLLRKIKKYLTRLWLENLMNGHKWEDQELITRILEWCVHMEISERGSENEKYVELVVDEIVTVSIVQVQ